MLKRVSFQVILLLCAMYFLMSLQQIHVKDARIFSVGYEERLSPSEIRRISHIIGILINDGYLHLIIQPQTLKNPSPLLRSNEHFINGTNDSIIVNIPSVHKFANQDTIGCVDYMISPTHRFYAFFVGTYIIVAFFLWFVYNGGRGVAIAFLHRHEKALLILVSSISLFCIINNLSSIVIQQGQLYGARNDSGDMQWYPSTQYWGTNGYDSIINPFAQTMNNNIFLSNTANYGHLLYILMYPFALLEFDKAKLLWGILNESCLILVFLYIYRIFRDKGYPLLYFSCLMLLFCISNVHAWSIYRGQISLVMTLFALLAFYYRHNTFILNIALSILITKYSFGVPILLGFFVAGYIRACLYAILVSLLAAVLFAYQFNMGIIESIYYPLNVAEHYAFHPGVDLYTMLKKHITQKYIMIPLFLCGIAIWAMIIYKRKSTTIAIITSSLYISLCLFPHHFYDYCMVLACIAIYASATNVNKRLLYMGLIVSAMLVFLTPSRIYTSICYLYALYLVFKDSINQPMLDTKPNHSYSKVIKMHNLQ